VDTLQHEGVPVLRAVAGSPAARAGVQPGDLVAGADGQPVKRTADLIAAVAAKKPGERVVLQLRGAAPGAQPRGVELTLGASRREIPLFDPEIVYNKAMMDLRAVVEGYPGTEAAAYAWLNLALCAMHFSDYAGAHDYLQKAKAELPLRPGLSRGTALYYIGLALDKLGYRPRALDAYRAAAEAQDATLIDNDGPGVPALATRRAAP
jgi:tetratricopeptide (TPR) repeat protein